ncbi:hypothetical protein FRC04_003457 [Tulasnella sp. 424]|nr:hypothetical protein FRC04_003457 [Tulasnella sp. 424]KAG8965778.1 hypothetical protein FRC05_003037 [Tulasnella sp. 425]
MRGPTQVRSIYHPPRDRSSALPASGHNIPLRNIQELPPEILAEGLLGSMTDDQIFGLRRQRELASVCRKWRDVVLSTPQFWNAVTDDAKVGDPFLIVPVKLRRFEDTLLTVKYINEPTDPESGVWDLLQSTTSRWKEATLTLGSRNHSNLNSTLEHGMPNIRRLTLLSTGVTQEVRFGPTPRLAELCLYGMSLDIISRMTLSTLRRLTVQGVDSESPLFINFLPTLAGCPLLEFIHLETIFHVGFKRIAHVADLNVTLPFLKILKLKRVHASLVSLLFQHLRADGLEQLRVCCLELPGETMAVLQVLSEPRHGGGLILPVLSCRDTSSELSLSVGRGWLTIEDRTKRLSVDFGFNEWDVSNLADLLRPVYQYCAASTRRIRMFVCIDRLRSLESLHFLCGAAPMVTRVHCKDRKGYGLSRCVLDGISQNACQICSPGGRTRSNTFSRLSELRIYAKDGSIPSPECIRAVHVAYLSRQRIVQGKAASSGDDPLEDLPDLKIFVDNKFVPPDLGSLDQDS